MAVDLSIVVAVYNEDPRNLIHLLERLYRAIQPTGRTYEVIFVNDGSKRPTTEALSRLASECDNVRLVVLSRNFGQQAAISAGFDHSQGDAIVNIDSDCQDPPELIPDMVRYWKEGYDVVYAQRMARKDKLSKRLSAFLFYRILGAVSSVKIPWDTGDFRLVDRKVYDALASMPEKSRFLRGQIPWLGFRQIGIPIERNAREMGESTYTLRKLLSLAMDGLLGFSVAPLFLIPLVGFALLFLGTATLGLGLVLNYAGMTLPLVAWLAATLAAFTGLQAFLLGIVAVYLSKVLDEVRGRPTYVVSERVGLPLAGSVAPEGRAAPAGRLADPALKPVGTGSGKMTEAGSGALVEVGTGKR